MYEKNYENYMDNKYFMIYQGRTWGVNPPPLQNYFPVTALRFTNNNNK